MDSRAIEGVTTRVLGAPRGSEPGAVAGLPVRDDPAPRGLGPAIRSYWHLEPSELGELARGGHVRLTVYGPGHPVVSLGVVKAADPSSIFDPDAVPPPPEPGPPEPPDHSRPRRHGP